ncbi:MAG: response regulator [Opitutaceae bacterium]|jgi:DNA-binding NtrC family response regulator
MNREYLIVDDEPDVCWAFENILALKGLRCQRALSTQAALDLMKHHRFHLAFLDVALPGTVNGFELAKRLREMDPSMRLVFVSGCFPEDPGIAAQIQNGERFCACITKPFLNEKILEVIKELAATEG